MKDLTQLILRLNQSYKNDKAINRLCGDHLPSKPDVFAILCMIRKLLFPDFYIRGWKKGNCRKRLLQKLYSLLQREITKSLVFKERKKKITLMPDNNQYCHLYGELYKHCTEEASNLAHAALATLPHIREILDTDIEASYAGDPAAGSQEEVILAYPVIEALFTYRFAHELWKLDVPLMPRMMTEIMHSTTGIDIHPGARIGASFFIDHASAVVIGETTVIGEHVKLYQGVTLGALSVDSREIQKKRHPSIEDHVTIYSGATILGGDTVIGHHSVIGGNVWITSSIAPYSKIYYRPRQ